MMPQLHHHKDMHHYLTSTFLSVLSGHPIISTMTATQLLNSIIQNSSLSSQKSGELTSTIQHLFVKIKSRHTKLFNITQKSINTYIKTIPTWNVQQMRQLPPCAVGPHYCKIIILLAMEQLDTKRHMFSLFVIKEVPTQL